VIAEPTGYNPWSEKHVNARKAYDERLLSNTERAQVRKAKGDAEYRSRNYKKAYEHYTIALESTPDSHLLLANRCQAYLQVGRVELALADAQRALALAPDWAKGHYRLGCCLQRLQREAEAVVAFERAHALAPSAETSRAVDAARAQQAERERLEREIEVARKSTTRRQALDAKAEAEYKAKLAAKKKGLIASVADFTDEMREQFEAKYAAEWRPPPGVQLIEQSEQSATESQQVATLQSQQPATRGLLQPEVRTDANAGEEEDKDGPCLEEDDELCLEENDVGAGSCHDAVAVPADAVRRGGNMAEVATSARASAAESDEPELVLELNDGVKGGAAASGSEEDEAVLELNDSGADGADVSAAAAHAIGAESGDSNAVGARAHGDDDGISEHSDDDAALSEEEEEKPPDVFEVGSTKLILPPRNYILVHEDGRLHGKDRFEPMSFGMQRVHYESEPEPVWVQTHSARWLQSATEITVIAHRVPTRLMRRDALVVEIAARQLHVSSRESGEVYLHGELEHLIDPKSSTWCTDGSQVTLTCVKANLMLYDARAKGAEADTHWHRLFTTDQYTERGMIDANYFDIPDHIKHRNKMAELERKAKQKEEEEQNACPLCGKDVRFFCDCRSGDKDYERPLPEGWKNTQLGFHDPIFGDVRYNMANGKQLAPTPPPKPQPYRGGR